jgi:hypothetical protein
MGKPLTRTGSRAMAEKLDEKEVVTFKELLMSQMIQLDAVTQLLIEKGSYHRMSFTGN